MSCPSRVLSVSSPARSLPMLWARAKEPKSIQRRRELRRVDWELQKGNYTAALSLVKHMHRISGSLRSFGAAKLVPKKVVELDGMDMNLLDTMSLRRLVDSIMHSIKCSLEFASCDEEASNLMIKNSLDTDSGEVSSSPLEDHRICIQHEAGHFLVGYLVGVLPYRFKVPSVEDLMHDEFAQGNVEFHGFDFLRDTGARTVSHKKLIKRKLKAEVNTIKVSSKPLNRFLCTTLGGLVAEYLEFGYSELLHSDVEKLDRVLKLLYSRDGDANLRLRWATLNTLLILIHYCEARSRLAEAMSSGQSISCCIDVIERTLDED